MRTRQSQGNGDVAGESEIVVPAPRPRGRPPKKNSAPTATPAARKRPLTPGYDHDSDPEDSLDGGACEGTVDVRPPGSEGLIIRRDMYAGLIENIYETVFDEDLFGGLTNADLSIRRDSLCSHYDRFMDAHERVLMALNDAPLDQLQVLNRCEKRFMEAKGRLDTVLDAEDRRHNFVEPATPSAPSAVQYVASEKVDVGTFSGNFGDWPQFHDVFVANVHRTQMSDSQKVQVLRKACTEEALKIIGRWTLIGENYADIWRELCVFYEDSHRTKQTYVREMFALPVMRQENHEELRGIIGTIRGSLRQLRGMGVPTDGWDEIVIHLVLTKLPARTVDAIESKRAELDEEFKLSTLLDILTSRAKARQAVDQRAKRGTKFSTPVTDADLVGTTSPENPKTRALPHQTIEGESGSSPWPFRWTP